MTSAVGGQAVLSDLPVLAALGLVLVLAVAVLAVRAPHLLLVLGVVLAVAQPPAGLDFSIGADGRQVSYSDLLLPLAALCGLLRRSRTPRQDLFAWALTGLVVCGFAAGALSGEPFKAMTQDGRGIVYLLGTYFAASRLLVRRDLRPALAATSAVLWLTTVAMVLSSVTGADLLSGRIQQVTQQSSAAHRAQSFDATRFLLNPKDLALVALVVGLLVLSSAGADLERRRWALLGFVLPGFTMSFLAYSRSVLLALAVVLALAVLLSRRLDLSTGVLVRAGGVAVLLAATVGLAGSVPGLSDPQGNFFARQVAAFDGRVIQGLEVQQVASSPGNEFRVREAGYALTSIAEHPAFGRGLGTSYRPDVVATGELNSFRNNLTYGARFVHNSLLFYAVKLGLVGLAVLLLFLLRPAVWALLCGPAERPEDRLARTLDGAVALGVLSVLVVSLFQADLQQSQTGPVLGALVAWLALRQAGALPASAGPVPVSTSRGAARPPGPS